MVFVRKIIVIVKVNEIFIKFGVKLFVKLFNIWNFMYLFEINFIIINKVCLVEFNFVIKVYEWWLNVIY